MLRKIGKVVMASTKGVAIFLLILLTSVAHAADVNVTLTADKTTASLEDTITLEVNVTGGGGSEPVITHANDFDVQSVGTSSQIQIINGQFSSSKSYRFELTPKKTGTFTVGPAQVKVDGVLHESQPLTLIITGGTATAPQATRDRQAFVEIEASNKNPYVGEQVLYTIRFYTRVPIQNVQLKSPEFEGFLKESLGDSRSYQKVIEGQSWQISEIQWALYPMSAGEVTIASPKLIAESLVSARSRFPSLFDDPFFNRDRFFREPKKQSLTGDAITLGVKTLPETGKPPDFSGLVGSFQMSQQSIQQEIEAGQSATMTITVKGDGDLRGLSELPWQTPSDVKVYDDQPTLTTNPSPTGLHQTKTFRKAIVPLKAGDLTLPPVTLPYFDPRSGEYKTLGTSPLTLKVLPSAHPELLPPVSSQQEFSQPASENWLSKITNFLKGPMPRWLRYLLASCFSLIVLLLIGRVFFQRRQKKLAADPHYHRRKKALPTALKRLGSLPSKSGRDFFEEASLILRDFLGDKYGLDGRALTTHDIPQKFPGVSADQIDSIVSFLHRSEEAVYGGLALTNEEKKNIPNTLKNLLKVISKS